MLHSTLDDFSACHEAVVVTEYLSETQMQATEKGTLRPFHETIVDAISHASSNEMEGFATLIKATRIPKNHDAIIGAWNKRRGELCWGDEDLGVPVLLFEQKEESKKNAKQPEVQLSALSSGKWTLQGLDWFDGGFYPIGAEHDSLTKAEEAARAVLGELEESQPSASSGGQGPNGIQDHVYIVSPTGNKYRFHG